MKGMPHPAAGRTVKVVFRKGHPQMPNTKGVPLDFRVEDWWITLTGKSWRDSAAAGNPAAIIYSMRREFAGLLPDDDVIYGKIGAFGHLVHASELVSD